MDLDKIICLTVGVCFVAVATFGICEDMNTTKQKHSCIIEATTDIKAMLCRNI